MKTAFFALLCLSASVVLSAETVVVSDVTVTQNPDDLGVLVTYTLAGSPAVVLADIQTNGVSIGKEHLRRLSGNVNSSVSPGTGRRN